MKYIDPTMPFRAAGEKQFIATFKSIL